MALDLLDAPLRISWDLCAPDGCAPLGRRELLQVGAQVTDAGVFFVALENHPLRHPALPELWEQLHGGGCQLSLRTDGSSEERQVFAGLTPPCTLFLDAAAFLEAGQLDEETLAEALAELRTFQQPIALLWTPQRGQLSLLPALLDICGRHRIGHLKLPNQKIAAGGRAARENWPDLEDLTELRALLNGGKIPATTGLQLEIHDLFLWELLHPLAESERSEYGGCQAANSLGHITSSGELWPCSSWPEPLGSLLEEDLVDQWNSARRAQVRQAVEAPPRGCEGCRDYSICFGGCRGLARFGCSDGGGRDLLCAGRR